jgi:hypothetical protein
VEFSIFKPWYGRNDFIKVSRDQKRIMSAFLEINCKTACNNDPPLAGIGIQN